MNQEELKELASTILSNLDNQALVTENLNKILIDNENTITNINKSQEDFQNLQKANEDLRRVNMEFFTQLGNQKSNTDNLDKPVNLETEHNEPLTFENLFNERGELK